MVIQLNGVFVSERLQEMIRKYATKPDRFFSEGKVDEEYLDRIVSEHIVVDEVKDHRARIKGTNIMVCDIIVDSWSLQNARDRLQYGGIVQEEAVDAAYAFLMRNHNKVNRDFQETFDQSLPEALYK